jgi:hypothetical protein
VAADLAREEIPDALLEGSRELDGGRVELRLPNRRSLQARLGARQWAALEPERRLFPTPEALPGLAELAGARVEAIDSPQSRRAQAWMWQTLVNAFTLGQNVARDLRSRRLRAGGARARIRLVLDLLVTAVAAVPLAVISAPLEWAAALGGGGGELVAKVALPSGPRPVEPPAPEARSRSARPA